MKQKKHSVTTRILVLASWLLFMTLIVLFRSLPWETWIAGERPAPTLSSGQPDKEATQKVEPGSTLEEILSSENGGNSAPEVGRVYNSLSGTMLTANSFFTYDQRKELLLAASSKTMIIWDRAFFNAKFGYFLDDGNKWQMYSPESNPLQDSATTYFRNRQKQELQSSAEVNESNAPIFLNSKYGYEACFTAEGKDSFQIR